MKLVTDPLAELSHEVSPGLIWKYPNRLLWLISYDCPSKCSFCFRKELNNRRVEPAKLTQVKELIKKQPLIVEIIFSGGEPLIDISLLYQSILDLSKNKQIKIFRIHTRLPITFPEKIDWKILGNLPDKIKQPIYMVIHTNHPNEIDRPEVVEAITKLRMSGYILLSQTVFLKGINDDVEVLEKLFSQLVALGVKPYYIFHCDTMAHTKKMVVSIAKEVKIMTELRKRISGLAYPLHVIDSETGSGKIPAPTNFWKTDLSSYSDFSGVVSTVCTKTVSST